MQMVCATTQGEFFQMKIPPIYANGQGLYISQFSQNTYYINQVKHSESKSLLCAQPGFQGASELNMQKTVVFTWYIIKPWQKFFHKHAWHCFVFGSTKNKRNWRLDIESVITRVKQTHVKHTQIAMLAMLNIFMCKIVILFIFLSEF